MLEQCELRVTPARLREVVLAYRFECFTGGRQRGQEDITSHERKGISGDWRNYFTDRITRAFKERFGELLIATGYEDDLDWCAGPITLPFELPSFAANSRGTSGNLAFPFGPKKISLEPERAA